MTLWADYMRFCGAHSWYKHIPIEGEIYQFYYENDPGTDDMHWQFTNVPPDDPNNEVFKVKLGPFIHGMCCNKMREEYETCSFHIIIRIAKERGTWEQWISANYPHLAHLDLEDHNNSRALHEIYRNECKRKTA
jgi:hypothetical protein